jgi:hypothetical protein
MLVKERKGGFSAEKFGFSAITNHNGDFTNELVMQDFKR